MWKTARKGAGLREPLRRTKTMQDDDQKRQEPASNRPATGATGASEEANPATAVARLERKRQRSGIKADLRRLCETYSGEDVPPKLVDLAHQLEEALREQRLAEPRGQN